MKRIFLDYASSYANPSAIHKEGVLARKKIEKARVAIARILGAQSDEIIFTSSGTESNNLAILGVVNQVNQARTVNTVPHVITTNIEHPSVLETFRYLEKTGKAAVTYVPVEPNGIVDPKKIKEALRLNTVLVSVMYANNEIGTIQPIADIAKVIRQYRKSQTTNSKSQKNFNIQYPISNISYPFFHVDACQAINYLPINVSKLGVDLLTFNGSKIYGPKGVGALYKKRIVPLEPIMYGGGQEFGLRPGTENLPAIVGLARALEITEKMKGKEVGRLTKLRDYFISQLVHSNILTNVRMLINGDLVNRLPNNVNISVPGIESELLVLELDARGIAVSSKSACKSGEIGESYVIQAIRPKANLIEGSIRFSLGRQTTKNDVKYAVKAVKEIMEKYKKLVISN